MMTHLFGNNSINDCRTTIEKNQSQSNGIIQITHSMIAMYGTRPPLWGPGPVFNNIGGLRLKSWHNFKTFVLRKFCLKRVTLVGLILKSNVFILRYRHEYFGTR